MLYVGGSLVQDASPPAERETQLKPNAHRRTREENRRKTGTARRRLVFPAAAGTGLLVEAGGSLNSSQYANVRSHGQIQLNTLKNLLVK